MSKKTERPEFVEDEHLEYLDELLESGQINMFGAMPYLQRELFFTREEAKECFIYWVRTFGDENR